jgi:hypothetical protein
MMIGCAALLSWALSVPLIYIFPPSPGHSSPLTGNAGLIILSLAFIWSFLVLITAVTAIAGVFLVIISRGAQKGIGLSLIGAALAAAPMFLDKLLPPP